MTRGLLALVLAGACAGQIPAQTDTGDRRIRSIAYYPDRVVTLELAIGYAQMVEFADDERIENVVVGNSAAWQVTANKRGDRLVIKPAFGATTTDLIVTTGSRRYVFILTLGSEASAPFVVRFEYPQPAAEIAATPVADYRFRGARELFPISMTDDGQRTHVSWARDTSLPAIFAIDRQGHENIVNGRMVAGDFVIEGVADRYLFRRDAMRASASRHRLDGRP